MYNGLGTVTKMKNLIYLWILFIYLFYLEFLIMIWVFYMNGA